jgi:hypothetical protein
VKIASGEGPKEEDPLNAVIPFDFLHDSVQFFVEFLSIHFLEEGRVA